MLMYRLRCALCVGRAAPGGGAPLGRTPPAGRQVGPEPRAGLRRPRPRPAPGAGDAIHLVKNGVSRDGLRLSAVPCTHANGGSAVSRRTLRFVVRISLKLFSSRPAITF